MTNLSTGLISGNIIFNIPDKPLFIEALNDIISFNPSSSKCLLFLIKRTTDEKRLKSTCFWVIYGYF